jgi:hypothetical protein
MEYGLQLPWRKHYSALDFLTSSAFSDTNPTDETSGRSKPEPLKTPLFRVYYDSE